MQSWRQWILIPTFELSLSKANSKKEECLEIGLGWSLEDFGSKETQAALQQVAGVTPPPRVVKLAVTESTSKGKHKSELRSFLLLKSKLSDFVSAKSAKGNSKKTSGPQSSTQKEVITALTVASTRLDDSTLGAEGSAFALGMQAGAALLAEAEVQKTLHPDKKSVHLALNFLGGIKTLPHRVSFLVGLLYRSASLRQIRKRQTKVVLELIPGLFTQQEILQAQTLVESMLLTRSLVNMPGNVLNPSSYQDCVETLVSELKGKAKSQIFFAEEAKVPVSLEVIDAAELKKLGCGLILAVGGGALEAPRILKLSYKPKSKGKKIALIGKGITFDTGGLDIKTSGFMRNMKKDMGGSASALGVFVQAVRAGATQEIICYLAVAENAVSEKSMRPGDVYTARNGVRVEIDNTDAEGRLLLADALCLAKEDEPDLILELATLTGAARTALGPNVDALFSNRPQLAWKIFELGQESGDWVWPLPLVGSYGAFLESTSADCSNSASSPKGGAITAALFLEKFVGGVPWVHLDTYMWCDAPHDLQHEAGATAKCVRLLSSFLALQEGALV